MRMDKNEAEEVVKNTIEYANEEIKKSKKRYLKIFLSCLLALFVCIAIMFIIYKTNDKVRDIYAVVFVTDIDKMEMSEGNIIKEITSKTLIINHLKGIKKLKETPTIKYLNIDIMKNQIIQNRLVIIIKYNTKHKLKFFYS